MEELFGNNKAEDYTIQGSPAWHEFRKKHIGASEVPAIMGTCDFKNIFDVWLEKTGLLSKPVDNFATKRGSHFEPQIRAEYELKFGIAANPTVLEYTEWPILSASLDGYYETNNEKVVVEIKYPSKEKHELALSGIVPSTYVDQLQAQLLVTNAHFAHYVSFNPELDTEKRLAVVKVLPDKIRQKQILLECQKFWGLVQSKTPPDGLAIQDELEHELEIIEKYKNEIKALEAMIEELENSVKSKMKASKVIAKDYTISWVERKGNIDYKAIEELKHVDLEKYRKPSSMYLKITKAKNKTM